MFAIMILPSKPENSFMIFVLCFLSVIAIIEGPLPEIVAQYAPFYINPIMSFGSEFKMDVVAIPLSIAAFQ